MGEGADLDAIVEGVCHHEPPLQVDRDPTRELEVRRPCSATAPHYYTAEFEGVVGSNFRALCDPLYFRP